ncbi:hypothetical protein K439DRAFT_948395 [Ramaria rubella]|nr:hypothetical protein K439DRAFT_948395 [Ramaria rubella]
MPRIYGPFFDEELFSYHDTRSTFQLDAVEIFHTKMGFIGLNDLETIYNKGREGSFDQVMFSGIMTLTKTKHLCEGGFKMLLKNVERVDPSVTSETLHKSCKLGAIRVKIQCQLSTMPVCYLTKSPANSIVFYSKNYNNMTRQRRYTVNSFHILCFRRSELTLQRYMVYKFVQDVCIRHRNTVLKEDRDVHWLVKLYVEDYAAAFKNHQRPRLHRSEVYDHFAMHAKWLRGIFMKKPIVDRVKWEEWIEEVKQSKKKAKAAGVHWGTRVKREIQKQDGEEDFSDDDNSLARDDEQDNMPIYNLDVDDLEETPPESDGESSSETDASDSDDDQVYYTHDPSLHSRTHCGLFMPMPTPTWYWTCNIKSGCTFVIDIGSKRRQDAPCMSPLNDTEKNYLMSSVWGLYDVKLGKIWRKMCQAHMDWHWKEVGLIIDHEQKTIRGVEVGNLI